MTRTNRNSPGQSWKFYWSFMICWHLFQTLLLVALRIKLREGYKNVFSTRDVVSFISYIIGWGGVYHLHGDKMPITNRQVNMIYSEMNGFFLDFGLQRAPNPLKTRTKCTSYHCDITVKHFWNCQKKVFLPVLWYPSHYWCYS